MRLLFVCTGNTCRSPMAEAIARGLVREHVHSQGPEPESVEDDAGRAFEFSSAGIGAFAGAPPASEGVRAVRSLGFEPPNGVSQALTRQMIKDADVIWTMTRGHKEAVLAMAPEARGKVQVIDPEGRDVEDPIGLGQDTYNQTARHLRSLIAARLKEILA